MSYFTTYECKISNMEHVKASLLDMNLQFTTDTVIEDWAHQKRHVDLAVLKDGKVLPIGIQNNEGELDLVADWFKTPFNQRSFTNELSQLHSKHQVKQACEENGWSFDDVETNAEGELVISASHFG